MRQITARTARRSAAATPSQSGKAAHIHSIVRLARKAFGIGPGDGSQPPEQGPPIKRAAEEGWLMRYLSAIVAPLGISVTLLVGQAVAQVDPPAPPECPIKTAVENTVIARAWHDDVINRRNPAILQDILASDVVHHAAGGYPKVMGATGITAMMTEFLSAFPDLRYTFDQFIVQDDYVVERYTAVGTQHGQLGDPRPQAARQPGLESISFASSADESWRSGRRSMPWVEGSSSWALLWPTLRDSPSPRRPLTLRARHHRG
jgi:hypothetical protein